MPLGLDFGTGELPRAVVVTFAMGDSATELVWHSYVLDRTRSTFRYLGEDPVVSDDEPPGPGSVPGPEDGDLVAAGEAVTRRFDDLLFERHLDLRPCSRLTSGPR